MYRRPWQQPRHMKFVFSDLPTFQLTVSQEPQFFDCWHAPTQTPSQEKHCQPRATK